MVRSLAFAIMLGGCLVSAVGHVPAAASPLKSLDEYNYCIFTRGVALK